MAEFDTVIALGSNLGDRIANLRGGLAEMVQAGFAVTAVSSVWETAPVPADQPPFLNAAVRGATVLGPLELLATLKAIEQRLGRTPSRRWGPRLIDLDILFYGPNSFETEDLQIPHIRIPERAFVLAPLSEVFEGPLPVLGRTAQELLDALDASGVQRTSLALVPPAAHSTT